MSIDLGRRSFLRAGAAAGGGMFFQLFLNSCAGEEAPAPEATDGAQLATPNIWLTITRDQIIFISRRGVS